MSKDHEALIARAVFDSALVSIMIIKHEELCMNVD